MSLLGRILSGILTALIAGLLCCNLYLIGARAMGSEKHPGIFGYSAAVVISGSMSGSIEINDMVVFHREGQYLPGDVITYESGGALVTHRILEETEAGFITKGDANNTADREIVSAEQIVGKVVLVIPKIGKFIEYLRTPLGMTCTVLAGFALIEVPALLSRKPEAPVGKKGGKYAKK